MRCRTCEYSLWGIRERVCPECGSGFLPSDFEFRPRAVAFECPGCGQEYYGTGPRGALVPAAFACVRCGEQCAMDAMVLRPAPGVEEANAELSRLRNPWERRREIGRVRAWLRTVGASFASPAGLIARSAPDGSVSAAIGFAVCTLMIALALMMSLIALFVLGLGSAGYSIYSLAGVVVFFSVGAIGLVLLVSAWSGAAHSFFRVTGGAEHGFRRSCQCVCYSSGVNMISAVPLLGIYLAPVGWLWWGIVAMVMFRRGQGVSWGRAAAAGLTPPMLALAGVAVWIAWMYSIALGAGGATAWFLINDETEVVTSAMIPAINGGTLGHAGELLADGALMPEDFVVSGSLSSVDSIFVSGVAVGEIVKSDVMTQRRLAREATAVLPAGVVAHRLGDFVFTHHGVDVSDPAHAEVWIVIASPDPEVDHGDAVWDALWAGSADGTVDMIFSDMASNLYATQNNLRESLGLPAIPDPATVTHSAPAVQP